MWKTAQAAQTWKFQMQKCIRGHMANLTTLGTKSLELWEKKIDHFCVLNDRLYRGQGNYSENSSSHTFPVKNYALRGHSKNTSLIGGRM